MSVHTLLDAYENIVTINDLQKYNLTHLEYITLPEIMTDVSLNGFCFTPSNHVKSWCIKNGLIIATRTESGWILVPHPRR